MPRRCAATFPLVWEKTSLCSISFFVFVEQAEWRKGPMRQIHFLARLVEGVARRNIPVDPSGLITSVEGGIVSCGIRCVPDFNGTDIHWRG